MKQADDIIVIPDTVDDRYASFKFISWWDQAKVSNSTVMVVGAGALGNEVLKNLALMGIGRLFIVDFDTVEPGNLGRSVLFRQEDSGRRKAEVAAEAVKAVNPDVAVQAFHGDINHDLGWGILRRMDVIIGCLDNREARLSLNRFCYQLSKPWVDGAIEILLGYARVFWPGQGACYECTLTNRDYQLINIRHSCGLIARENLLQGKVPTTPTAASIIGGIQTQEALKLIHGMDVQPGVSIIFNGLTNESYTTRLRRKETCLSHAMLDDIVELPQARANTTTPTELLAVTRDLLGSEARLYLGHNLITDLRCLHCGVAESVLLPHFRLTESLAICPHCGRQRIPEVLNDLDGNEDAAQHTLYEIGVPPLAILIVYNEEKTVGLELTGDVTTTLNFS